MRPERCWPLDIAVSFAVGGPFSRPTVVGSTPAGSGPSQPTNTDPYRAEQPTATFSASHTARIRASASRPRRSTRTPIETLSIESRLTADDRDTGSVSGSRTTSLGRPRMVVVHGATSALRSRGMAGSRDRMTTGLRPMSGSSAHHSSPRQGKFFMTTLQLCATMPSRPIRRAGLGAGCRKWRTLRRLRRRGLRPKAP